VLKCLAFRLRMQRLGFGVKGSGFRVLGIVLEHSGIRFRGSKFRVEVSGLSIRFKVQDLGFRV